MGMAKLSGYCVRCDHCEILPVFLMRATEEAAAKAAAEAGWVQHPGTHFVTCPACQPSQARPAATDDDLVDLVDDPHDPTGGH